MYNHWRYARRIDADNLGIYHNDGTKLLQMDKGTADYIILMGGLGTGKKLVIRANDTDTYPQTIYQAGDVVNSLASATDRFYVNNTTTNIHILDGAGVHFMAETVTPTPIANFGAIYCKADNKLYFQDGAGAEHTVTIV